MKGIIKKSAVMLFGMLLLSVAFAAARPVPAHAAPLVAPQHLAITCPTGQVDDPSTPVQACIACPNFKDTTYKGTGTACFISKYVNPFVNFMAAAVGIFVLISFIVAGIQYSSAGGDPGKVSAAKKRAFNSVVALLAFFVLYAFLNWVLPGGIGN